MAHFAEIDKDNKVIRVLVTNNEDTNEGYDWLVNRLGGRWIKTSFNTHGGKHMQGGFPLRKNFASIGNTYDEKLDAFIAPKPFKSWVLNKDTCLWEAPKQEPDDENIYDWDESKKDWTISE